MQLQFGIDIAEGDLRRGIERGEVAVVGGDLLQKG